MKYTILIIISFLILATAVSAAVMTGGEYELNIAGQHSGSGMTLTGGGYELDLTIGQGYTPSPPMMTGGGYELCLGFLCMIQDKYTRTRECPWVLHWNDDLVLTDPDEYFLSPICSGAPSDTTECSGENDCVYNGVCYSADNDPDTVEFTISGEPASCTQGKWCPQYFTSIKVGNEWYCKWYSQELCFDAPCSHTQFTPPWFSKKPDCCSPDGRTSCCVKKVWDGVYYYTKNQIIIY